MSKTKESSHQWKEVLIGSIADVEVGGTPSTAVPSFWGGNIPWMSSGEVNQRRINDVQGRITELGLRSSNAKLINPPAVALALAGQGKTRGTVALTLISLCTNQSVALIKGLDGLLDTVFLFHALDARYDELRNRSAGGGRAGLSKSIIESIPLALPKLKEQQKIAEILDTVDRAIALTQTQIAKLKQAKAGLLHDLLTRGINEHGELRNPTRNPEQFKDSPLGKIPKDWEIENVKQCIKTIEQGWSPDCESFKAEPGEWGVLKTTAVVWEGYQDIENKCLPSNLNPRPNYEVKPNDVLVTRAGPNSRVGVVALVKKTQPKLMLSDKLYRLYQF